MKYNSHQKRKYSANPLSGLPKTVNKKDTHKYNHKMETTQNNYDIDELLEGMFYITFQKIYLYQWK